MSSRRIGAPVAVTVAFGNESSFIRSIAATASTPSSSIDRLPGRRTTIEAWLGSLRNVSCDRRIAPVLSNSRKSIQSGLSIVRSSGGISPARSRVRTESSCRAVASSLPGSAAASARRVIVPAIPRVGSPPGVSPWTSVSVYSSTVSGVITET